MHTADGRVACIFTSDLGVCVFAHGLISAEQANVSHRSSQKTGTKHPTTSRVHNLQGGSGQDVQESYAQFEGLCQAILSELASDQRLHDCDILPDGLVLPKITAVEYCKVLPDAH